MTEIATASAASASQADASVSWGGTALTPEAGVEKPPSEPEPHRFHPQNSGDLFERLHPYLLKGVDILNAERPGAPPSLVERAKEKWMREVRSLVEPTHPEFALYFVPQAAGREPSMRLLVQRLSRFLQTLRPFWIISARYGAGHKNIDPRERISALTEGDRVNFIVDEATMGGDPAPGEAKRLIVRWMHNGKEFSRSFDEGTHVELPDPSEDQP